MVKFIPWSSQTKGTSLLLVYISHNLNHLSAYHVTSSRMSLGLRVYSSPLFFDPVSLLMAYQQLQSWYRASALSLHLQLSGIIIKLTWLHVLTQRAVFST